MVKQGYPLHLWRDRLEPELLRFLYHHRVQIAVDKSTGRRDSHDMTLLVDHLAVSFNLIAEQGVSCVLETLFLVVKTKLVLRSDGRQILFRRTRRVMPQRWMPLRDELFLRLLMWQLIGVAPRGGNVDVHTRQLPVREESLRLGLLCGLLLDFFFNLLVSERFIVLFESFKTTLKLLHLEAVFHLWALTLRKGLINWRHLVILKVQLDFSLLQELVFSE
jgi:hypothetical protein